MNQLLLSDFLKNQGMKRASDHAERHYPDWKERALDYLKRFPWSRFMAEDVRTWAYQNGLPEAPSGRAWGAVIVRARKLGLIKFDGHQNVSNPRAHSTPAAVWVPRVTPSVASSPIRVSASKVGTLEAGGAALWRSKR